jgi:YVTN family beta-propeller protein
MRAVLRRAGTSILAITLLLICFAALAGGAAARTAYYTGSGEAEGFAAPVNLETGAVGAQVPVETEGTPPDVAISPDGSTAYVPAYNELVRIDVASNSKLSAIPMSVTPWAIAISPDGTRAYTADFFDEGVSVIDLATGAEIGTPIPVGEFPAGIAVTPDGTRVYVANELSESVSVIDVASNAVIATIPVGTPGEEIAVAPSGNRAFALPFEGSVTPIDLTTDTVGTGVPFTGFGGDIAILPDGSRAYITNRESQVVPPQLLPLNLGTETFESGLEVSGEEAEALAIVPDQPPHAAFSASPEAAAPGETVGFDASASTDPDGNVARYDWDFGDGTSAANAGATPSHAYAKAGTYQVTLTTTDNEGCSTEVVFTGQTAYCNGSAVARATRTVTVEEAAAKCPSIAPKATSFKPRVRPGHVVPGVRVRLATGTPARLTVRAKLLWKHHATKLHGLSVNVRRWRRVRFPIPAKLRNALPLGTRVTVKLQVTARPRQGSCKAKTTHKTLHLRVVKVFPNAVQAKRPR